MEKKSILNLAETLKSPSGVRVEIEEMSLSSTNSIQDMMILDMLAFFENHCTGETRQKPIKNFVMRTILKKDPDTKNGRKESNSIDLCTVNWKSLSDRDLLDAYQLVVRRTYIQM